MALASKKYEKFYETTGTGKDKIDTAKLTTAENAWAVEKAKGCADYMADPIFAPIIYQMQQMQDELDELRSEISTNKDKTGITTSQASAITANTAKVSQGLNTANHTLEFDVVNSKGSYTLGITVTDNSTGKPVIKTAAITLS